MRILHAIVAFLTVVLLFIQQKYVSVCAGACARPCSEACSTKQSISAWPPSSGDSSLTPLPLLAAGCVVCARAARSHEERGRPKYKRDPEIAVDNEFIGYHPHDDE